MLPWSDNVQNQPSELHPKKLDVNDFDVKERAFPFCVTPQKAKDGSHPFIEIDEYSVTFRMQRGPIKEVGVNGCQIDDLIKFVSDTIFVLNKKFPCRENSLMITKLEEAWLWGLARKLDREARNVEGFNKD